MLARDAVKTSNLWSDRLNSPPSMAPCIFDCSADRYASLNHQKSAPASVSGSSTTSNDTGATTPTSSGDKKKRKKKKKSVSTNGASADNQDGSNHSNGDASNDAKKKSIFAVRSGDDNQESADPSQLPLSKRLEIAASHGDIHAALVGLLGWSRLYVNTDTILEFFQSSALEMLLENIFQACPNTDAVYDNLNALLANCLSIERDGKPSSSNRGIANAIVAAVRSIVDKLRGASEQEAVAIKKASQYLSKIILHYRLSLNGVDVGSALSQEILRIDAELASAASKDGAVQGQTIRDTFQRRDIRCEALALYESRLVKINKLVQDNISSSTQHLQADKTQRKQVNGNGSSDGASSGFLAFLVGDNEDDTKDSIELDPKELEAIKGQLDKLNERKAAAIEPLATKRQANEAALQHLKKKREELEAQLRALDSEIEDAMTVQHSLDDEVASVEEKFEDEMSRFDSENQHIIQQCQRKERREQIEIAFSELQDTITKISLEHSDVQSLKEKRVVCMRQHLEGILRYFASELPCVKFMMGRVEQSEAQLKKYTDEAEGYKALGVSAVAKELLEKATSLQGHIDEDKSCLQALQKRDLELLATIKRLFRDPEHTNSVAALDPALTKEVQRHVDYITKLYEPFFQASSNGDGDDTHLSRPAKSANSGASRSQKKK